MGTFYYMNVVKKANVAHVHTADRLAVGETYSIYRSS
jgi:hypothetical protein